MYRITGDERHQDQGWRMFVDWVEQTQTDWGFASVQDVGSRDPKLTDKMESFVVSACLGLVSPSLRAYY